MDNRKRGSALLAVLIILIIIVAGYAFIKQEPEPQLSAAEVLDQMWAASINEESSHLDIKLDVEVQIADDTKDEELDTNVFNPGANELGFSLSITGDGGFTASDNTSGEINIRTSLTKNVPLLGTGLLFDIDIKSLQDDATYLRLNGLNNTVLSFAPVVSDYMHTWIRFTEAEYFKALGMSDEEVQKSVDASKSLASDESIQELIRIFNESGVLELVESYEPERVNGDLPYHVKTIINKEGLIKLFNELSMLIDESGLAIASSPQLANAGSDSYTEIVSLLEEELKSSDIDFSLVPIELWLGVEDLMLRKALVNVDISEFVSDESVGGTVVLDINISDYGKKLDIKATLESRPLDEVMQELRSMFGPVLEIEG